MCSNNVALATADSEVPNQERVNVIAIDASTQKLGSLVKTPAKWKINSGNNSTYCVLPP